MCRNTIDFFCILILYLAILLSHLLVLVDFQWIPWNILICKIIWLHHLAADCRTYPSPFSFVPHLGKPKKVSGTLPLQGSSKFAHGNPYTSLYLTTIKAKVTPSLLKQSGTAWVSAALPRKSHDVRNKCFQSFLVHVCHQNLDIWTNWGEGNTDLMLYGKTTKHGKSRS